MRNRFLLLLLQLAIGLHVVQSASLERLGNHLLMMSMHVIRWIPTRIVSTLRLSQMAVQMNLKSWLIAETSFAVFGLANHLLFSSSPGHGSHTSILFFKTVESKSLLQITDRLKLCRLGGRSRDPPVNPIILIGHTSRISAVSYQAHRV